MLDHIQQIAPAEGDWSPLEAGPFEAVGGPLFQTFMDLAPDEPVRLGFRVETKHCNSFGVCHGGMMSTFMDMALGRAMIVGVKPDGPSPTITLTVDFLDAALPGHWIESRTRLVRASYKTAFCDTIAYGPKGPVARAMRKMALARAKS